MEGNVNNVNNAMTNIQNYFETTARRFEEAMNLVEAKDSDGLSETEKKMYEQLKKDAVEAAKELAEHLNKIMQSMQKDLRFHPFVDGTDLAYVEVINPSTQEVIRQIPPEQMIEALVRIHNAIGLIIDRYL